MNALTDQQIRSFAESGYLVLTGLVSAEDLDRASAEVDRLIAEAPPPEGHVGHHFYFRSPQQSPAFFDLLLRPGGILDAAGDLVAPGRGHVAFDQAQLALNIPPYFHRPGRPHIDGYAPGRAVPGTFTLLAGLLLSDQEGENGGNLWVWPGTHIAHAKFFATYGPQAFTAYPDIELPEPTQIRGGRGDVLR